MASSWEGVSVALNDSLFTVSPTWTRLDTGQTGLRVAEIQIQRGRQSEFDETGPGTCTVLFHDRNGLLDPTNTGSPFYGKLLSRPLAIAIRNPVTDVWEERFRGTIDDCGYNLVRSRVKFDTAIVAVDAFDYFSNFEFAPGQAGFVHAAVNEAGVIAYPIAEVDARILDVLDDCDWPTGLSSVFEGNVDVEESRYSPGDKIMQALQEAVEAEFPGGAALHYIDRRGFYQFHGRYARINPDEVSATASNWDFVRWAAGDNTAAAADATTAKMHPPYGFSLSRKMIYNVALAYPQPVDGNDNVDLSDFLVEDATSRARHGTRTWVAPDLKTYGRKLGVTTAKEECMLYAQWAVAAYKDPRLRINSFTIGTEHPTGSYGPATWDMITRCDISDAVEITIDHPGSGGLTSVDFYIEGLHETYRPGPGSLDNAYPIAQMSCDLSPAAYWDESISPFPEYGAS